MRFKSAITALICLAAVLDAQATPLPGTRVTVTSSDAGSFPNNRSTLRRQAFTLHDAAFAADFVGDAVITTSSEGGDYFKTSFEVRAIKDVVAIEVRFWLFDAFKNYLKVLRTVEVADVKAGTSLRIDHNWPASSDEVSEYLASMAFISQVMTQTGCVVRFDPTPIVAQAMNFTRLPPPNWMTLERDPPNGTVHIGETIGAAAAKPCP